MLSKEQAVRMGDAIIQNQEAIRVAELNRKAPRVLFVYDCEALRALEPYQRAAIVREAQLAVRHDRRAIALSVVCVLVCFAFWLFLRGASPNIAVWFLLYFFAAFLPPLLYRVALTRRQVRALVEAHQSGAHHAVGG